MTYTQDEHLVCGKEAQTDVAWRKVDKNGDHDTQPSKLDSEW